MESSTEKVRDKNSEKQSTSTPTKTAVMKSSHQKIMFVCRMCSSGFNEKQEFWTHIWTHTQVKQFKCEICGWAFKQMSTLKEHIHAMHFSCVFCDKGFSSQREEWEHIMSSHIEEMPPPQNEITLDSDKPKKLNNQNQCPICKKTFVNVHNFRRHVKVTHSSIRPFKCGKCEMAFKYRQNLMIHENRKHRLKDKEYWCVFCTKGFYAKHNLYQHLKTHVMERPYSCRYCNASFLHSRDYVRHTRRLHSCKT